LAAKVSRSTCEPLKTASEQHESKSGIVTRAFSSFHPMRKSRMDVRQTRQAISCYGSPNGWRGACCTAATLSRGVKMQSRFATVYFSAPTVRIRTRALPGSSGSYPAQEAPSFPDQGSAFLDQTPASVTHATQP
jgi:hypothetical protein